MQLAGSLVGINKLDTSALLPPSKAASYSLEPLFASIAEALDRQDLALALRLADRARRIGPGDAACKLLYARILIKAGDPREALAHLRDEDNPNVVLTRGTAFLELGELKRASQCCVDLLQRFCVDAADGLASFAERVSESIESPGWVGVDPKLQLVGQAAKGKTIELRTEKGVEPAAFVARRSGSPNNFVGRLPSGSTGPIVVTGNGCELLGSGLLWPPELRFSGWVTLEDSQLAGEARLAWAPRLSLGLELSFSGKAPGRTIEARSIPPSDQGSFSIQLSPTEVNATSIHVAALLPGEDRLPLVGSPLTSVRGRRKNGRKRNHHSDHGHSGGTIAASISDSVVDIVVPVYAGMKETLDCLNSLFVTIDPDMAEIVVVNDASPEEELVEALAQLDASGRITLLTNTNNLGYAGAVNRGIGLHPNRDVILLNSDTEVFGDWMQRLAKAAHTSSDVGTVTPLGQSGSITDYGDRALWRSALAEEIDAVASRVNATTTIDLPVGVGFCMYIKRRCLEQTGEFDAATFVRGYGEENDFCLRARSYGWRHVAAASVFVKHHGGRSFGEAARLLKQRNGRVLDTLHPSYFTSLEKFAIADPLLAARRAIDIDRLKRVPSEMVLLITHDLGGGVSRHVRERRAAIEGAGQTVLTLRPILLQDTQPRVKIEVPGFQDLIFEIPLALNLLSELLRDLRLHFIELHHFLRLPAQLLGMLTELDVPYDIYLHDYSWICPRVSLIDGSGRYCGEPELPGCENCIRKNGSSMEGPLTVGALRKRSASLLEGAREVFVPSIDTLARFTRYFPTQGFTTMPWEDLSGQAALKPVKSAGRLCVAVIGAIGRPKGYQLLLECARDAAARELDLEFVVIGYTSDDQALLDTGRVFITGPYDEGEVKTLLDREGCHIAFFPSVAPETWCYSLTHAIDYGFPIIALDLGAQAERLRTYAAFELLNASSTAEQVNRSLVQAAARFNASHFKQDDTMELNQIPEQKPADGFKSRNLVSSVEILKLPHGIYSFSLKGVGLVQKEAEKLALPALQIGVAPIVSQGTVEFLTGRSALDRWLAYGTDMILVRILGGDASLILTSVHTAESTPINVDVKRLDADSSSVAEQDQPEATSVQPSHGLLSTRLLAHIRFVGDIDFEGGRAGWAGQQMWIEGFAVRSIGHLPPEDFEYRGLVANGFQTPWLRPSTLCGSRGGGLPLLGFAVRLKNQASERWLCEYSGTFLSGMKAGPISDGALCCSGMFNDPLESIEVCVRKRTSALSGFV
jgi:GT2 family glycosyltransferase